MSAPSEQWLEEVNRRLSKDGVPHKTRPWAAWLSWARESGSAGANDDPTIRQIFHWFAKRSPQGSQQIGPAYVGVLYYDAALWPFVIPVVFGTRALMIEDALASMPDVIRRKLLADGSLEEALGDLMIDCADYGLRFPELLRQQKSNEFARDMFHAADRKLRASVNLLLGKQLNSDAAEAARFAVEMFLKGLLAVVDSLDELGAQSLGHDLDEVLDRAIAITNERALTTLKPQLSVLPPINRRYRRVDDDADALWHCYLVAQACGAIVVRMRCGSGVLRRLP